MRLAGKSVLYQIAIIFSESDRTSTSLVKTSRVSLPELTFYYWYPKGIYLPEEARQTCLPIFVK